MIVVTGATGNVGRPLVHALLAAGEQVTAVSRRGSAPDGPAVGQPASFRHERADLAEPESLKPALDGAEALFLLLPGGIGAPVEVLELAKTAGVRRVVLLSSQGVGTRRHPPEAEDAVQRSGLEWTVLRPGGFASNSLLWAEAVRARRLVAAPFGDVALPVVDPADIAEVAAVVLRSADHGGRTYELTGPVAISPRQQAAAIADVLGELVRFVEQSRAEAREGLLGFMPEQVADATLDVLGSPSPGEQLVSPDIERLLGRAPRTFAEWAARNAAAFR